MRYPFWCLIKRVCSKLSINDLEDSFQYQCALTAQCDVFITINIRDFRDVDFAYMNIMTPQEFVDKYLEPAKKLF